MMGFAGLEFTSASGKKFQCTPMALASSAVMRPKASAFSVLPAAPKAIAWGKTVVPFRRMDTPRSKSAETMRGSFDERCSRLSNSAATSGWLLSRTGPSTGTLMTTDPMRYLRMLSRSCTKMGSASFRNCTLTQIAKSWPTLSSGDILRNVLSAHFRPALSRWMGPGGRKRSLLLSFAKQSVAASRSAISGKRRNMQVTIACSRGDGRGRPALHRHPRRILDFPFDGCDALLLDGWVIAKPGQPMHIRLSPEPRDLALGIVTMRLLCRGERRLPIQFAAQELHRLLVSERCQRAGLVAILREKLFRFGDQSSSRPSLVKHVRSPLVDAGIEGLALGIESETQDAKAVQRFASLLPKFGHGRAKGRARRQTHLDRPDHLGNVMGVNTARCRSVEPAQDAMQVLGPIFLRAATQSVAQFFRPLRTGEESFDQSAEIESGSSADNRQALALLDRAQDLPPQAGKLSGADIVERIDTIHQVMRNFRALRRAGLGRADFELAVHRHRIAVDDLTREAPGNRER